MEAAVAEGPAAQRVATPGARPPHVPLPRAAADGALPGPADPVLRASGAGAWARPSAPGCSAPATSSSCPTRSR